MCYEQLLTTIQLSWMPKEQFPILALGPWLVVLYLRPMLTLRIGRFYHTPLQPIKKQVRHDTSAPLLPFHHQQCNIVHFTLKLLIFFI